MTTAAKTTSNTQLPDNLMENYGPALDKWFDERFDRKIEDREANKTPSMAIIATKASAWESLRDETFDEIFNSLPAPEQARIRVRSGALIEEHQALAVNNLGNYGTWQAGQVENDFRNSLMEELYPDRVPRRRIYTDMLVQEVEASLQRLGTDYLDILMCPHGGSAPGSLQIPEIHEAIHRLKRDGKIRYFGFSAHNNTAGMLRAAAAGGEYDMAMVAYNVGNAPWAEPALEVAAKADMGIIAMKVARAVHPDRGRRNVQALPGLVEKLQAQVPGDLHIAEKAYLLALQNPNITGCVSAMTNAEMVGRNTAVAGKKI